MKSQVISASHHGANEVIQNHRQDQARDDGSPKRIQRIFHGFLRKGGDSVAAILARRTPRAPKTSLIEGLTLQCGVHPYATLTPDVVLNSLDAIGFHCDGRLLSLNSYENRVYQVGQEEGPTVVAKFYRPARWTDAQIAEEHRFARELQEAEIPVVAPIAHEGRTLHESTGFRFTVYPRQGGRTPELEDPSTLEWI